MLRAHLTHRMAGADKSDAAVRPARKAANDHASVPQTDPFMFTRLFVVTGIVLGGLALAGMLSN
ncbi:MULTISPECIES: hypothetical protein [Hyphomicrobiales]|uniref:hypothetical protein n=1 Tax=Hyphomicrobiales TaxID=356 RepID=UPI0003A914E8|nr:MULTISPECIES: hypothetical protein [Phyllobacteriaceae]MCX8567452.1 hypothetical protein [Aminobacter sp. MET-1]